MNRNRLKILPALAAALVLAGCGAAGEKAGNNNAGADAASGVNAPSPAPTSGPNAAPANAAGAQAASAAGGDAARQPLLEVKGTGAASNKPPAKMPTPQVGSGGSDFFLFTQARAAVVADPGLKSANIILDVKEGVVTLNGAVAGEAQKSKAEQLVRSAGARAVKNQLRVSGGN